MAYNALDLFVWGLVLDDVKRDLRLSDTQLGVLSGFAYSLFYALMGFPIARWADRGFRVAVISLATLLSGIALALIGATQTFAQLLLVRIAVAVGDAGCAPASQSLIASHFTRAERPQASSLVLVGATTAGVVGPPLAGWLSEAYGWRATFMLIGWVGLVLGVVAWWTLRRFETGTTDSMCETPHQRESAQKFIAAVDPNYGDVLSTLRASKALRYILLGWVIATLLGTGLATWEAVFFRRVHGLQTAELGAWLGAVKLLGLAGIYGGGHLASRYAPNDERRQLRAMGIAFAAFAVLGASVYLVSDYRMAFALKSLKAVAGYLVIAPTFALLQTLVAPAVRATMFAAYLFLNHFFGGGAGPLAVGAFSDMLEPLLGLESIRYALIATCPGYLLGGWCFWRASRTVMSDIAHVIAVNDRSKAPASAIP